MCGLYLSDALCDFAPADTLPLLLALGHPDILAKLEGHLGGSLGPSSTAQVTFVRSVAPNKDMLCLSFRLPEHIAFADATAHPAAKRQKLS